MDLPTVDKKLREAIFFLKKMVEHEKLLFADKEIFDFYLSAFLSATRTVDYRLRHEQAALYPIWRKAWDKTLTPAMEHLMKFLVDDRNVEVHARGSVRMEKVEKIPIGNNYFDGSGKVTCVTPIGYPPAMVHKPAYFFTIDGTEQKARDACAAYLSLLRGMVEKFKADNP